MATERKLFEASEAAELKQLQLKFSRAMTEKISSINDNGGLAFHTPVHRIEHETRLVIKTRAHKTIAC